MNQPTFISTSRGTINLSRVLYIKPAERGLCRFVFGKDEYIDVPADEAERLLADDVRM
jgi:hypothetical protein